VLEKFQALPNLGLRVSQPKRSRCGLALHHCAATRLAVQRSIENGEIRERFRTPKPREADRTPIGCTRIAAKFTFMR